MSRLQQARQLRLDKLHALRQLGIDPFPAQSKKDYANAYVVEHFDELSGKVISVTGRIMSLRNHGPLLFIDLRDASGTIQLFIAEESLQPTNPKQQTIGYEHIGLIDAGDFLQATGPIVKTKTGQVSMQPTTLQILTKTLRPLPDKWEGITDPEVIFRRRYLDLAVNPERHQLFLRKAMFWKATREFLDQKGFVEVETPFLEHVTGGADARPFVTHMNALDQDFFLRISTELYQKRLIGGGFEKIFTLGPNFRNEGLSEEHLPEFMDVEWYWAYADYQDNMQLVREWLLYAAKKVYGKTVFQKNGHTFDLSDKWQEINYPEIIRERFGVDIFTASGSSMLKILKENGVKLEGEINRNRLIDNLWKLIRKTIPGPAYLVNEPKFMSPLAKSKAANPTLTERFHVILAGSELGNGYSELNDPIDQLERFQEQQAQRAAGDEEAQMLDIDFVEMLEYGMPPTSGFGASERVFWFLEGVTAREGTFFPQLKFKIDDSTREIYGIARPAPRPPKEKAEARKSATEPTASVVSEPPVLSTGGPLPSREKSLALLKTHIKNPALLLHCLLVAVAMEAYAQKLGQDAELWYQTGLLHDIDWEEHPDEHPNLAISDWLAHYPVELKSAIAAHAPDRTGKEPETLIEKYLFACDELSGFIHAASLMRPMGYEGMEVSSVKKKLKDKRFAANVSREDITRGAELIETAIEDHISFLIPVLAAEVAAQI